MKFWAIRPNNFVVTLINMIDKTAIRKFENFVGKRLPTLRRAYNAVALSGGAVLTPECKLCLDTTQTSALHKEIDRLKLDSNDLDRLIQILKVMRRWEKETRPCSKCSHLVEAVNVLNPESGRISPALVEASLGDYWGESRDSSFLVEAKTEEKEEEVENDATNLQFKMSL